MGLFLVFLGRIELVWDKIDVKINFWFFFYHWGGSQGCPKVPEKCLKSAQIRSRCQMLSFRAEDSISTLLYLINVGPRLLIFNPFSQAYMAIWYPTSINFQSKVQTYLLWSCEFKKEKKSISQKLPLKGIVYFMTLYENSLVFFDIY